MKRLTTKILMLLTATVLFSCNTVKKQDPLSLYSELDKSTSDNTLADKEKDNGWQLLFDGQNFTGWHGYNMSGIPEVWIIEDNSLTMTTVGGAESQDIIT